MHCGSLLGKDMVKFLPLQKNGLANVQQTPPCAPLGRHSPPRQGALQKVCTPQSEPDPFPNLTLETGLDETRERSWVSFSFGKENQTRIQWVPLMAQCWDFSTYLEIGVCCSACARTVSDCAKLFCPQFLLRSSSFHVVFSLFCHFALPLSLLFPILPKKLLH